MTKKDAYAIGLDVADEINANGDFDEKELASEDAFAQAFYEIAENRQQYAGDVTEDFRRDSEWEGYEEGLAAGLAKIVRKRKFATNPSMSRGHFQMVAGVLAANRPAPGARGWDLWNRLVEDFASEMRRGNPAFDYEKFVQATMR